MVRFICQNGIQVSGEYRIEITVTNFVVEPENVKDDTLTLTGDEAKHLSHVLRAKAGDVFFAIDGSGRKYRAVIMVMDRGIIKAEISSVTRLENEPFYHVTLAQGICRPARMDEIVEKGTEIGVTSFVFYYSEKAYGQVVEDQASAHKVIRLERVARAAAKQCRRSVIPSIEPLASFNDILRSRIEYDLALVAAVHRESKPPAGQLTDTTGIKRILLMVGPESGLSDEETERTIEAGFRPVLLGPRRLRTETAGIIFPALVLNLLGDL
jgi:16S rRNA (uracil1498-N3)-methyltransferase